MNCKFLKRPSIPTSREYSNSWKTAVATTSLWSWSLGETSSKRLDRCNPFQSSSAQVSSTNCVWPSITCTTWASCTETWSQRTSCARHSMRIKSPSSSQISGSRLISTLISLKHYHWEAPYTWLRSCAKRNHMTTKSMFGLSEWSCTCLWLAQLPFQAKTNSRSTIK